MLSTLYASDISFEQVLMGLILCMDTFYVYVMLLHVCYATDSMWSYVNKISSLWCVLVIRLPNHSYFRVAYYFRTFPHLTGF